MKPLSKTGFTIIEIILFLGISGALILGVLLGTGTSINTQRYHDSVSSLRSYLQQQYSEVMNVSNNSTDSTCNSSLLSSRGQSECVILGRYITTSNNGFRLNSSMVIGYLDPSIDVLSSDDVEALKEYNIVVSSATDNETYDIEWGASIVDTSTSPMVFSMLILRSPSSGVIRTFIDNTSATNASNIINLLVPNALNESAKLCVSPNGLFTGPKMAVFVEKNATSTNGIKILGENNGCS